MINTLLMKQQQVQESIRRDSNRGYHKKLKKIYRYIVYQSEIMSCGISNRLWLNSQKENIEKKTKKIIYI